MLLYFIFEFVSLIKFAFRPIKIQTFIYYYQITIIIISKIRGKKTFNKYKIASPLQTISKIQLSLL